ncbi:hypothetical protein [Microbacterium sp.]|uniref:hypothetical protein n=1 Tax=Microbacterium sp. TaxID=51671 RepID=UPI0039E3AE06
MVDPHPARMGGHDLPARFSEMPEPPARRRPHRGAALWFAGFLAAAAVLGGLQLCANLGYDGAAADYEAQARTTSETLAETASAVDALDAAHDAASQIIGVDDGALADPATHAGLETAVADTEAVLLASADLIASDIPDAGTKPGWFWELFAESSRLGAQRAEIGELEDDLSALQVDVGDAGAEVEEKGLALLDSATAATDASEAAHISTKNDAVVALRATAAQVSEVDTIDQVAADAFLGLTRAAEQIVATERIELAEKAGPLLSARLEVEAFARSLAPDVLLEFDWSPVVNGAGERGSMGGYTSWWWSPPGRAVIELSDSVAAQWPTDASKALIAHEVGHAISVKCQGMYDPSTQESIEDWATAWAISMGFHDDANGVWAYGYPPQSYIDAAAGCR